MDRACLYNLNIALRQIGQMELALRYTWDVLKRVQMKNKETQTLNPEVGWYRNVLDKCHGKHITFVCVKWGRKYGPEYVNSLSRAIRARWCNTHCKTNPKANLNSKAECCNEQCVTPNYSFICFTEDASGIDSDIRCRPFPADDSRIKMWSGWWLKCSLWAPTVEEELRQARLSAQSTTGGIDDQGGWVVYLDLDTVITGSMNIFNWKSECHTSPATFDKHFMYLLSTDGMVNEHRSFGINSSVMIWYNNKSRSTSKDIEHYASASTSKKENNLDSEERFAFLYRYLIENYKDVLQCIYKFDHYLEMMLLHRSHDTKRMHGENEKICKFIQNEFPNTVADFLTLEPALCRHSNRDADHPMPARETSASQITSSALEAKGVALVCFPLLPKPLEVRDYCPWVAEYFATKLETRREGAL